MQLAIAQGAELIFRGLDLQGVNDLFARGLGETIGQILEAVLEGGRVFLAYEIEPHPVPNDNHHMALRFRESRRDGGRADNPQDQ